MSWTTEHELEFIKKIGTGAFTEGLGSGQRLQRASRAELLAGYLAGCLLRDDWGEIDKDCVVLAAENALSVVLGE